MELAERTALITGASRGIGLAIAKEFLARGAAVMLSSRRGENLAAAAAGLDGEFAVFPAHAGDPEQAGRCVGATLDRFGRLDILVNNAAANPSLGRLIDADLHCVDKTLTVNVLGPLAWTQATWRHAMARTGGCVVNIASIGALYGGGPTGAYNLSKAALTHLTRHLAAELGPHVRVNAVAPGLVETEFSRALWDGRGTEPWPWPMRRAGRVEDVAAAVTYLASDRAAWVTGHVLVVDGGAMTDGSWRGLSEKHRHGRDRFPANPGGPSMSEENKRRSRQLLSAWAEKTPEVLDEIVGDEWIDHDPAWPFPDLRGPEAAKAALELYRSVFPDLDVLVEDQLADGDKVVTRWVFEGTQTGDLPGVPATNRKFSVPGITIDVHRDGRMVETWSTWDTLGMYRQLGVAPPMGTD